MPVYWQFISAIFAAVVSLGVIWKVLDKVWRDLDKKVDKNEYSEYCKRIDERMIAGQKQFEDIRASIGTQGSVLQEICLNMETMKGTMRRMADKLDVPMRREEEHR